MMRGNRKEERERERKKEKKKAKRPQDLVIVKKKVERYRNFIMTS